MISTLKNPDKNNWLKKLTIFGAIFGTIVFLVTTGKATDFPHRKDFVTIPTINFDELITEYEAGKAVIVDVRSKIEFVVIHPKGAVHEPISNITFTKNIEKLAQEHSSKKIVFYCNGINCLKSYEATQKAMDAGIQNVYAYGAGIPEWAYLVPEKTLLLGKEVPDTDSSGRKNPHGWSRLESFLWIPSYRTSS